MSDSAHPGTPLVGKLHMLLEISAEPYSSALVGTSFGRLDCLEQKVSYKSWTFWQQVRGLTRTDRLLKVLDCLVLAGVTVALLVMQPSELL